MFVTKVEFVYNVIAYDELEFIDRIFITLVINFKSDPQNTYDHPLFRLAFDYPPNKHYPPEDGWQQMKEAILKKEKYTLVVYNYDGALALEADEKGLFIRGLINYQGKRETAKHDGCHFFLPFDDDLRQELASRCDEIIKASAKVERD